MIRFSLAILIGISAQLAIAQTPILLNINSSTYPMAASVVNYQALGIHGLSGTEPISQFSPAFNVGLTSPMGFSGGQVMYLNTTADGGTWVKPVGAGANNGLMDCYLYRTTTTPCTITLSNLSLTADTSYTLYLIGTLPVHDGGENGRFQPVNTPNITFPTTIAGQGVVAFPFNTSGSYSNTDTLQFTWAKVSSGNASLQGLAIVPGVPTPVQSLAISNGFRSFVQLTDTTVTLSGQCELWATHALNPISGCIINLTSADAWFFLPNVQPSIAVQPTYLGQVQINGAPAIADGNCRVEQYGQTGAVIIPHSSVFQPLTVFSGPQFTGTARSYRPWTYYTGDGIMNISSFRLKRGYQAVMAQSANGVNYSKSYVAQDGDLEVGVLPGTLDKQVRFIHVTPWRWVSKKGACDIAPNDLQAKWWYNWNINDNSIRDREYVAIRQQPYWPGLNQNWQVRQVNHVSGYNEPNNPVEDAYKNLTPQGSVSDAVARLPDQLATGLRVGAPAVTDGGYSWIVDFVNQADAAGYRLDYVPVHYYRSYGNNANTQGAVDNLYNFLKGIHDAVKRPIWLTEFNNGANWTTDADPTFDQNRNIIEGMINMMDGTPWIERYSVYSAVEEVRQVFYNAGGYTPMGLMYRDHVAPLAYVQTMPDNGTRGLAQYLFAGNAWDTSGYYNNAMPVGAPRYTTGHVGQARSIVLDGVNSYVQLPANSARGNAFTFAAWVNWRGVGGAWQRIFDFGNDTTQYLFLTPNSGNDTLRFAIKNGGDEQVVERPGILSTGWQHIAVTLGGNTALIYVNGAQVASSTGFSIAPSAINPHRNFLGKSQWPDPLFNGMLEDVEIADYAMSAAQISALYTTGPYPSHTSGVWVNNGNGTWDASDNWSNGLIPNGVGRMADFSTLNISANRTVTVDSPRTVGGLRFGDTVGGQNWGLGGSSTLTLDGGGGNTASIAVYQNTATISAPLAGATGFIKTGPGTLSLSGAHSSFSGPMKMNGGAVTIAAGSASLAGASMAWGTSGSVTGTLNILGGGTFNSTRWITAFDGQNAAVSGAATVNVLNGVLNAEGDLVVAYAGNGSGTMNIAPGGTVNVASTSERWLIMNQWDTTRANLVVNGGTLTLNANTDIRFSTGGYGPNASVGQSAVTLNSGAIIGGGGSVIDLNNNADNAVNNMLNLNGGSLTIGGIVSGKANGSRVVNFNGGTLRAAASSANFFAGGAASAANVQAGGAVIDTDGHDIAISQSLVAAGGGLTKKGAGRLTLSGVCTYAGSTIISNGTLALSGSGSMGGSQSIHVAGGAVLEVSAVGYVLGASQTLSGNGTVTGTATIAGTVAPGASIGTLTFGSAPAMDGRVLMEIDRTQGPNADKLVVGSGTLTYGGTLTVTNIGGLLQAGDRFQLFSAPGYGGKFATTNLPTLGAGLAWSNSLAADGTIAVVSAVALVPTNLLFSLSGTQLKLAWPTDHTGWRLQSQTNALTAGLGTNWFDVPGSTQTNAIVLPVKASSGSVLYRLIYP